MLWLIAYSYKLLIRRSEVQAATVVPLSKAPNLLCSCIMDDPSPGPQLPNTLGHVKRRKSLCCNAYTSKRTTPFYYPKKSMLIIKLFFSPVIFTGLYYTLNW